MNAITPTRQSVVDQIFGQNKAPIDTVLKADFAEIIAEAEALCERGRALPGKITTEADQIKVGVFIAEARAFWKKADGLRTDEKAPILEAGRGLDAFFKTIGTDLDDVTGPLQRAADTYVSECLAIARAKAKREEDEARAKADAERKKAEDAKSTGAAANAEARADALDAKADRAGDVAASSAADLTRIRGGGVTASGKEVWGAVIEDYVAAIAPLGALGPYFKRDALEAALSSLVNIQKDAAVWPGVRFSTSAKANFRT